MVLSIEPNVVGYCGPAMVFYREPEHRPQHLNQPMPLDHNEQLPLAIMPVLALGDSRLGDDDGDLATVLGDDQFGEGNTVVNVHLQGILELL